MKKFVSGLIVGVLLFAGASAFAESVGIVGKKVTGTFTVKYKSGEKIADAAIINGSAYVPVRAMANATQTELTVVGKEIIMDSEQSTLADNTVKIEQLRGLRDIVARNIQSIEGGIKMYETDAIPRAKIAYDNSIGTVEEAGRKKWLDDLTKLYEEDKEKLVDLQKQLADLDAQIAALQQ